MVFLLRACVKSVANEDKFTSESRIDELALPRLEWLNSSQKQHPVMELC